jgi:hypothetical protein
MKLVLPSGSYQTSMDMNEAGLTSCPYQANIGMTLYHITSGLIFGSLISESEPESRFQIGSHPTTTKGVHVSRVISTNSLDFNKRGLVEK